MFKLVACKSLENKKPADVAGFLFAANKYLIGNYLSLVSL